MAHHHRQQNLQKLTLRNLHNLIVLAPKLATELYATKAKLHDNI
jgi:hypothetical protein